MQIKEVLDAIRPRAIRGAVRDSRIITHLLTDSRQLAANSDKSGEQQAERTLFFAIETDKDSGANYIPDLIRRGVRTFVLDARHESGQWSVISGQWSVISVCLSMCRTCCARCKTSLPTSAPSAIAP